MEDDNSSSSYSLKQRIKNSILFSCCFGRHNYLPSPPSPSDDNPSLIWVKPNEKGNAFSEIKDKCKSLFGISAKHRKHSSMDYSYDPLSYSLNFEDGIDKDESAPLKNFCARLPPSPPLISS